MATCANCLHHSLCDYNTNISGNGKVRLVYSEGADVKCSFFENTANVVPKSEVEEISGKYEDLKLKYADLQKDKDELIAWGGDKKAEVAREIFEEIEEVIAQSNEISDIRMRELAPHTYKVMREAGKLYYTAIIKALAELKKKYTEVEHDRNSEG